jgi:hypothetical protein
MEMYYTYRRRITERDNELEARLKSIATKVLIL